MEWLIVFGMASSCYAIYKLIIFFFNSNNQDVSKFWRVFLGIIIFISVFGCGYYYEETTRIKDGEIYYVNLFEKLDDQKNYRVPGKIDATEDGYKLIEVYWSNGGELTFFDSDRSLVVGKKIQVQDDKHKKWFVEMTDVKSETKK